MTRMLRTGTEHCRRKKEDIMSHIESCLHDGTQQLKTKAKDTQKKKKKKVLRSKKTERKKKKERVLMYICSYVCYFFFFR